MTISPTVPVVMLLVMLTVSFGLNAQPDGPRTETPNLAIWERRFDDGSKLLVERAYLYGDPDRPNGAYGTYQFAFVTVTAAPESKRIVRWVHSGTEAMANPIRNPEIEVLDATMVGDELLILFNQYHACRAYRIKMDKEGRVTVQPKYERRTVLESPDDTCVGDRMSKGTVTLVDGALTVKCTNEKGEQHLRLHVDPEKKTSAWKPVQ